MGIPDFKCLAVVAGVFLEGRRSDTDFVFRVVRKDGLVIDNLKREQAEHQFGRAVLEAVNAQY